MLCLADASQSAQHRRLPFRGHPVLHQCVSHFRPIGVGLPHRRRGRRLRHLSLRRGPPLGAWLVVALGDTREHVGRPGQLPAKLTRCVVFVKKKKTFLCVFFRCAWDCKCRLDICSMVPTRSHILYLQERIFFRVSVYTMDIFLVLFGCTSDTGWVYHGSLVPFPCLLVRYCGGARIIFHQDF